MGYNREKRINKSRDIVAVPYHLKSTESLRVEFDADPRRLRKSSKKN